MDIQASCVDHVNGQNVEGFRTLNVLTSIHTYNLHCLILLTLCRHQPQLYNKTLHTKATTIIIVCFRYVQGKLKTCQNFNSNFYIAIAITSSSHTT